MYLLVIPLILALLVGWLASNKGKSFLGWFIYGLFLWPIALIHIFFVGNQSKKCPECFSKLDSRATVCPSCKHKFPPTEVKAEAQKREKSQNQKVMVAIGIIVAFVVVFQIIMNGSSASKSASTNTPAPSPTPIADDAWITQAGKDYYSSHIKMRWGSDQFYGGKLTTATAKELMGDCITELKSKEDCQNIIDKKFWIGMTSVWLTMSMGNPNDINKTVTGNLTEEQWIYGNPIYGATYIYVDNGTVKSYQN